MTTPATTTTANTNATTTSNPQLPTHIRPPLPNLLTALRIPTISSLIVQELTAGQPLTLAIEGEYLNWQSGLPNRIDNNPGGRARWQPFARASDIFHYRWHLHHYSGSPRYLETDPSMNGITALVQRNSRYFPQYRPETRDAVRRRTLTNLQESSLAGYQVIHPLRFTCGLIQLSNVLPPPTVFPQRFIRSISRNTTGIVHITPTWWSHEASGRFRFWLATLPPGCARYISFGSVLTTLNDRSNTTPPCSSTTFDAQAYFHGIVAGNVPLLTRLGAMGQSPHIFPDHLNAVHHLNLRDSVFLRQVSYRSFHPTANAQHVLHILYAQKYFPRSMNVGQPYAPDPDPNGVSQVLIDYDHAEVVAVMLQTNINRNDLSNIKTWTPWEMRDMFDRWFAEYKSNGARRDSIQFPDNDSNSYNRATSTTAFQAWVDLLNVNDPNQFLNQVHPAATMSTRNLEAYSCEATYIYHHPTGDQSAAQDQWRDLP